MCSSSRGGTGKSQPASTGAPGATRRAVLLTAVALLQWGCSGSVSTAEGPEGEGKGKRMDTTVHHEDCAIDSKSAERIDANGDGKADITIVKDGGSELCSAYDLNFDGRIDSFVYRDKAGNLRRRESDYDRDGRIDEIQVFKGGTLTEKHRATTLSGRLDTWHFYKAGKLSRTERDSDGDAMIDQWWEYPTASKLECPVIHSDVDGDGRPDPGATVDVCKEPGSGYVPPERSAGPKKDQLFGEDKTGGVPVELDKPDEGATEGGGDDGEGGESGGEQPPAKDTEGDK